MRYLLPFSTYFKLLGWAFQMVGTVYLMELIEIKTLILILLLAVVPREYIHPIVRGKEIKPVEFGAKVNTIQVDGINFIEHLSFSAFHEGIRLPQFVSTQQWLFKRKVTLLTADSIYATNSNRKNYSRRRIGG